MRRIVAGLLIAALLLAPLPAYATGCRTISYAGTYHAAKVAVVEKAVAVAQFVPVAVPIFSAFYAAPVAVAPAPAAAAPAQAQQQTQDALLRYLQRLEQRLDGIERRLAPGTAPLPPAQTGQPQAAAQPQQPQGQGQPDVASAMLALVLHKCAKCHGAGGQAGLTLLEGGRLIDPNRLTIKQQLELSKRTYIDDAKVMPPKNKNIPPVTDEEHAIVMAWLASVK